MPQQAGWELGIAMHHASWDRLWVVCLQFVTVLLAGLGVTVQ